MYDSLIGKINQAVIQNPLLLQTGWCIYRIEASLSLLQDVSDSEYRDDYTFTIPVHVVMREDAWSVYGFSSRVERDFFRKLLTVNNFGPVAAMGLVGKYTVAEIKDILRNENVESLSHVPGIGIQTALKLVASKNRLLRIEDGAD